MIAYLKGSVSNLTGETATVIVNGTIGFQVWLAEDDLLTIKKGAEVEIFCYHHQSERSQELYGFLSLAKKYFFKLLIDRVAGIGPKSALKIIGKSKLETLLEAIRAGDVGRLIAGGLGKKTAEKIIIGLQDKIGDAGGERNIKFISPIYQEALEALQNLGYKRIEAGTALERIDLTEKTLEAVIKEALRML